MYKPIQIDRENLTIMGDLFPDLTTLNCLSILKNIVKNDYQYIDPDYAYTDPETSVLRNRENINDAHLLRVFESMKVSVRLEELQSNPIRIKNSSTLLDIHRHLFQDIYSWAGKIRTVEISKGGKPFFPLSHFHNAFVSVDTLIVEYRKIDRKDETRLTHKLAEIQ